MLLLLATLNWPREVIRSMYRWVISWAQKKQAQQALAVISFAESSFFPIPPDPLLIAMVTAKPQRWVRYALICTVGSIVGGIFGYIIGVALFETVGQWVINTYHLHDQFSIMEQRYSENAFLATVVAGFTPIPYKLIAIAAGAFHVSLLIFIVASVVGRGARFFLVAYLMHHFGKRYADKIEKYIDVLGVIFITLVVVGFLAITLF